MSVYGTGQYGAGQYGDADYVQVIDIGGESTTQPGTQVRVTLRRVAKATASTASVVQARAWHRRVP